MSSSIHIPIHDFVTDNEESIHFKYVTLGELTSYDFSLPHRHNYYEIFLFNKGGGEHLIDFKSYPIRDNSIHFVSPGQVHMVKRSLSSNGTIIIFSRYFFNTGNTSPETLFQFPFLNNGQYPILDPGVAEFSEFATILKQVQKEQLKDSNVTAEILLNYLKVILFKCFELYERLHPQYAVKEMPEFNRFRELVEKQYRMQHNPSYFASELNMTEKRLNEICKQQTGDNVSAYIRDRILLEAKRLLSNTDHSVKEIAYFLGFNDYSYFTRFFRKSTGITPLQFRDDSK